MFRALLVDRSDDGFSAGLTELDDDALPEGDVLVDVAHSTVNQPLSVKVEGFKVSPFGRNVFSGVSITP